MSIIKPIKVKLSVLEMLFVLSCLSRIITDEERKEEDKEIAKALKEKILRKAKGQPIMEIGKL